MKLISTLQGILSVLTQTYSKFNAHNTIAASRIFFLFSFQSLLAYNPLKLSDYQRKDLAKHGIVKVICKYESKSTPKMTDTISIRQFDRQGFLTALDTFAPGKDSLYHFLYSQRITYSKKANLTLVRIDGIKMSDNNIYPTITTQTFNEYDKLIHETTIVNNDTLTWKYIYDYAGNCIEQSYQTGIKTDMVAVYKYEYDSNNRILKEEYYRNSVLSDITRKNYDKIGQLVEIKREGGMTEQFEYNSYGKKIRDEYICHFNEIQPGDSFGQRFLYSYNNLGQLIRIEQKYFKCYPSEKITVEYREELTYLPSGLIKSQCSLAGCYQFSYSKKSKK